MDSSLDIYANWYLNWGRSARQLYRASIACYIVAERSTDRLLELNADFMRAVLSSKLELAVLDTGDLDIDASLTTTGHMLLGFAIENAAKAVVLGTGRCAVIGSQLPRELKTHNLTELMKLARVSTSANEALVLKELERYIRWRGRYPIPTSAKDYEDHTDLRRRLRNAGLLGPPTREIGQAIFLRLDKVIYDDNHEECSEES